MLVCLLLFAPSASAELKFAVSGIHHLPDGIWAGLSDDEKIAFLEVRADLAVAMGASALRIGAASPSFWDYAGLGSSTDSGRWLFADKVVAALAQRNLTLVVVVPDLVSSGLTAYRNHIRALAERYDGDNDFGVQAVDNNRDFPDIDDTGAITSADWNAPGPQLTTWAQAHTIDVIQVGHLPFVGEQSGAIGGDDYGSQLKQGAGAIADAGTEIRAMLAGTLVVQEGPVGFASRLGTVSSDIIDIADAHIAEGTTDPTGVEVQGGLEDFTQWLQDSNIGGAERWVGAFAATADANGPCGKWTCDDRMQAATLAKAMLSAVRNGATHFTYNVPVEVTGTAADPAMPVGTGLLTIALSGAADLTATPIGARPAFATWMRLQTILADVSADDIVELSQLGPNTVGYQIGDKGWLLWYDWSTAVPPGNGYDSSKRGANLKGIPGLIEAVAASNLFPLSAEDTLGASFTVNADWDNTVYPVNGGEATIALGSDVVWVVPSALAQPEPGPEAAADSTPDTSVADPGPGDDDTGCSGGGAPTPHSPLSTLALALAIAAIVLVRRRSTKSVAVTN